MPYHMKNQISKREIRKHGKKIIPLMTNSDHVHIYMQRSQLRTDSYCVKCGEQKPKHIIDREVYQDMNKPLP